MNIAAALKWATQKIKSDSAKIDAEFLLAKALNQSLAWLKTWPEYNLNSSQQTQFNDYVLRRSQGEPVAYITGEKTFWNLSLITNNSTLIPRPETELLVELALDFLQDKPTAKILDLGTGTGAIALSIAAERKQKHIRDKIFACDIHSKIIQLAQQNAAKNQLNNVVFLQSNWFSHINQKNFDLILANPPYIAADDPHLTTDDLLFEPKSALVAEQQGLADIQQIICQAKIYLKPGSALMLEHGYQQASAVTDLLVKHKYSQIKTQQDYAGLDRITLAIWDD